MKHLILFLTLVISISTSASFTVGTQNLYHYQTRSEERIANLKREYVESPTPQIMGLQEAALWITGPNMYEEFMQLTGYKGIYAVTNNWGIVNDAVALVSNLPAENLVSHKLPSTEMFSRQSLNIGIFQTSIGKVVVVNSHHSPHDGNGWRRADQNKFILEKLKQYPAHLPVVIIGDLNDVYRSASMKVLIDAGFVDVLGGQGATWNPTTNPLLAEETKYGPHRLDYIMYKPSQLKVVNAGMIYTRNWISDHYGLRAEFALP